MTPTIIHRHTFALNEAVEALLGEAVGDCESWSLRVEGEEVIVDVIAPVCRTGNKYSDSIPTAESDPVAPDPEPCKGGALAKKAAMLCGRKPFQTFMDAQSADEAADAIRVACGVKSRAELDHDEAARAKFIEIDRRFSLWQEGFDV